ncbi:SMP-30/gluconolactonase/LRE family protein [Pedobacter immunditicola]|uniref:SMP-30/gluconolactonase/LRE family protein n=1 Tax=Pedobacter immunditicola TaxID=3133440 RepID=UPI00309F29D1
MKSPGEKSLFVQEELTLISSDFSFTEGCSPDKDGNVYFTDQPNDKIWKYSTTGELSLFLDKSGRSNGTYFDKDGNLLTCADEKGEIWSITPSGKISVLLADLNGKQLNGPNDLWVDPKGGIYLTDPYYQRPYWTRTKPDLESQDVYYLPKGSHAVKKIAGNFDRPNGIVGTPDGKYLYIADIGAGKIFRYSIDKEGGLKDKYLLINRGADGMTLDNKGNIYLTGGNGVFIYDKDGKSIATITVPKSTSNVCFSGKEKNVLFITARESIYTIPMTVKGVE